MTRLLLATIAAATLALAAVPPPAPSPGDGRYYPCGLITEHGVTEHLDAYKERCGQR